MCFRLILCDLLVIRWGNWGWMCVIRQDIFSHTWVSSQQTFSYHFFGCPSAFLSSVFLLGVFCYSTPVALFNLGWSKQVEKWVQGWGERFHKFYVFLLGSEGGEWVNGEGGVRMVHDFHLRLNLKSSVVLNSHIYFGLLVVNLTWSFQSKQNILSLLCLWISLHPLVSHLQGRETWTPVESPMQCNSYYEKLFPLANYYLT